MFNFFIVYDSMEFCYKCMNQFLHEKVIGFIIIEALKLRIVKLVEILKIA